MTEHRHTANKDLDSLKDSKLELSKALYSVLYEKPKSRRMAATETGYPDMTYMVTNPVKRWIEQGRAQVIGGVRCSRSGRKVEAVTTNPELFKQDNQLKLSL
jgi:RNA:NAD 2'-phosphotransferase (TPT1/KptA family)